MTTLARCTKIAHHYGYTEYLDLPGFWSFANPTTGRSVHFFMWSNPRLTQGGIIPDGYIVIIPDTADRIAVRTHAWPVRGLPARTWAQTEADIHRLVDPILASPDIEQQAELIAVLPREDTGEVGVLLLRE